MTKRLYVTSKSTPDQPGWLDWVEVWEDGKKLWEGPGSASPSPLAYREFAAAQEAGGNPKREDYTSDKRGGMIDYGTYNFIAVDHDKYKRSLMLNGGGEVDSRWPNPRHNKRPVLDEVFVHTGYEGDQDNERGSEGCITIRPDYWPEFQKVFKKGDEGEVIVVNPPALQGMGDVKARDAEQQQKMQSASQDIGTSYGDDAGTAMLMGVGKDPSDTQDSMRATKEVLTSVGTPAESQKSSIADLVDYITDKIWPWR